jgi:hypothetical protein
MDKKCHSEVTFSFQRQTNQLNPRKIGVHHVTERCFNVNPGVGVDKLGNPSTGNFWAKSIWKYSKTKGVDYWVL